MKNKDVGSFAIFFGTPADQPFEKPLMMIKSR